MSEAKRTTAAALPGAAREARETLLIRNGKPAFPKNKKLASLAKQLEQSLCMPAELGDAQTLLGVKFSTIFGARTPVIEAALLVETRKRFDALIKHYDLNDRKRDADTFILLALALANDFVPNFDVRNPGEEPGRPRSRGKIFGPSFLREVERVEKSRGRGVEDACLQLSRKGQRWHGYKSGTLATRYHEGKRASEAFMNEVRHLFAKGSAD